MKYLYYKDAGVHFWLESGQVHALGIGAPTPSEWPRTLTDTRMIAVSEGHLLTA